MEQSTFLLLMIGYGLICAPIAIGLPLIFSQCLMRAPSLPDEPPWLPAQGLLTSIAGTALAAKANPAPSQRAAP